MDFTDASLATNRLKFKFAAGEEPWAVNSRPYEPQSKTQIAALEAEQPFLDDEPMLAVALEARLLDL